MRALAAASLATLIIPALTGCGRIGYDSLTGGDDDGGPDAAFTALPCETPVLVADLGAPSSAAPARYAVEVAVTATGFVAIYQLGDGALFATGVAMNAAGEIDLIQTRGHVVDTMTSDVAAAALGDDVEVAVDDPVVGRMVLLDLSEFGYGDGDPAYVDTKRGAGHGFIAADPDTDRFIVAGINGTSTYRFTVDHDGNTIDSPVLVISGGSLVPEGVGVIPYPDGYAAFAGTTDECTVVPLDASWTATAAPSVDAMTCHNVGLTTVPSTNHVLASWNCDNDAVWTTSGPLSTPLPTHHSIYGDSSMSSSDPRITTTSAGVWYTWQTAGGRLGRTLLDGAGTPIAGNEPTIVRDNPRVKAHDLFTRDDKAFELWLESGSPADELYIMRLCR